MVLQWSLIAYSLAITPSHRVDRTNNAEIIENHPGMQTGKMNPDNNNPNRYEMGNNNNNGNDNTKKTQIKQTMTTKALVFVCVSQFSKSFVVIPFLSLFSDIISKNTELSFFGCSKFFHAHGCCGTELVVISISALQFGLFRSVARPLCALFLGRVCECTLCHKLFVMRFYCNRKNVSVSAIAFSFASWAHVSPSLTTSAH